MCIYLLQIFSVVERGGRIPSSFLLDKKEKEEGKKKGKKKYRENVGNRCRWKESGSINRSRFTVEVKFVARVFPAVRKVVVPSER